MAMARLNDLIRCEDAIKEICNQTCKLGVFCPDAYCKEVKEWITDDMVVDAVPVVRCKDCKFYHRMTAETGICELGCPYFGYDGFCSEGERKDGDTHDNSFFV